MIPYQENIADQSGYTFRQAREQGGTIVLEWDGDKPEDIPALTKEVTKRFTDSGYKNVHKQQLIWVDDVLTYSARVMKPKEPK